MSTHWMRAIRGAIAIAVAAGALAVAGPAQAGKKDDTLRVAMAEEILNLDYLYTTKREYIILSQLTDATLFELDPATQQFKPSVATSHRFVDDRTVDVKLRRDVVFHDGTPLTADDVVYTYNWVANKDSQSHAQGLVSRWLDRAEKTGDDTVRFHLKAVYPLVIRDMAQRIVLRKNFAYHPDGRLDGRVDRDAMASRLVGLGPYKVKSFRPGQELVLERFDRYLGEKPAIRNLVVRNLPDIGTQQAEMMSGGIDWMFNVPREIAESMAASRAAVHLRGPDLRVAFVVLDAAGQSDPDGPLTKLAVRQAINHALNRDEMAKYLLGGGAARGIHTACHPAQFGCLQSVKSYPYDPARAKALLAEAGYPKGFPLDLWAYREKPVAEAVAADLKAVGIAVRLRYVKLESLNQARAKHEIPAYIGTWGSSGVADTALIARIHFSKTSDRNLSGDDALSETVLAAERTNVPEERAALYAKAIGRIAEQAYWAPLFSYTADYLVSRDLEFPLDDDGVPRLQNSRWK